MLMWRPAAGRAALMNLVAGAVALLLLVGTSWLAFR
jgi:hypothetical protein